MLESIRVNNFQSLRKVDLPLGRLTVIVGPSSSGKSSVVRALRTLVSNARGASYVSRGQKVASVTATGENHSVTIERGEGHGVYRLLTDLHTDQEQEKTFTKLGGDVPEQVTAALGIKPFEDGTSLNFASQFDRPFLLTETGSTVARVLGELTNVSVIFAAAREANRRRLVAQSTLKIRQSDLVNLVAQLQKFQDLPVRVAQCSATEKILAT